METDTVLFDMYKKKRTVVLHLRPLFIVLVSASRYTPATDQWSGCGTHDWNTREEKSL